MSDFSYRDFETWWQVVGKYRTLGSEHSLALRGKDLAELAFEAGEDLPEWRDGQLAVEIETGIVWKVIDRCIDGETVVLVPLDCDLTDPKEWGPKSVEVSWGDVGNRWTQTPGAGRG